MAVQPIDADAINARREIWGTVRSSIRLGMLVTGLIFLSVPPIYLLDTFVPLLVGGSLIGLIALFKSPACFAPAATSTRPSTARAGRWRRWA